MIRGHRDAGHFATSTGDGIKVEGSTRQCCHCQYIWEYRPGSGTRRGWCLKHGGFLCARAECLAEQERLIAQYLALAGKVVSCLAFEEWNEFLGDRILSTPGKLSEDFTVTETGIILPR